MFFCHALETQKRTLQSKGEDVDGFPIVKCFERSDGPGGVWRSNRTHDEISGAVRPQSPSTVIVDPESPSSYEEEKKEDETLLAKPTSWEGSKITKQRKISSGETKSLSSSANMYSGLWTNGAKEMFEMYDYTYKDHFGDVQMPTHLPRKHILEYLIARVTKNNPDFFETYFSFCTTVENVRYLGDNTGSNSNKFRVQTLDENTGIETVEFFDKCIWAGGINGTPRFPQNTRRILEKGGFPGQVIHSTDTATFKEDVEGKNVLLVGGGLSSEDLAHMAIKEGVSNVYITCRGFDAEVNDTSRWPFDKVACYPSTQITSVNGREITLSGLYFDDDYVVDPEKEKTVLRNIDTIIFCTGYEKNVKYLDEALQSPLRLIDEGRMTIPSDWVMGGDHDILADKYKGIRPENDEVFIPQDVFYHYSDNLYKNAFCIDNPNMMYMIEFGESPLLSHEIKAWMLARVVSNQIALPSAEQMRAEEKEILLESLKCANVRYWSDWKYQEAIDDASKKDVDWNKWSAGLVYLREMECRFFGEIMNRFQYPVSFTEPDNKTFTDYFHAMNVAWAGDSRENLSEIEYDTTKEVDGWRSFRDYPGITEIRSYFTGIHAKLLPKPWAELDGSEKLW